MRIYFAGANNKHLLGFMAGRYVLETFANIRKITSRYRSTWAGGMLDSGAFTENSTGKKVDVYEYRDFCLQHGDFYDEIVNLDDIGGDVARTHKNQLFLEDAGLKPLPVFHQGEPWEVLRDYCGSYGYIGIGFQRPIRGGNAWLEECFARIPVGHKIHGFGMASKAGKFPFYSVDSTTWLWEMRSLLSLKGQGTDALRLLTPGEILDIVVKKYDRMEKCSTWAGVASNLLDLKGEVTVGNKK